MRGDVEVDDGAIVAVGRSTTARGRVAVPGFVDLQVNGFGGVDFIRASANDYRRVGQALLHTGVTAYQPTFTTAPEPVIVEALRALPDEDALPRVLGAHLEGPFLSAERLGVHPPVHRRDPDLELLERLLDAGRVSMMTLAPELPRADGLIGRLLERGVVASAGHTNATADEAYRAFDLGVSTVTHLWNAMRPLHSRDPGVIGAALVRRGVSVQLIVDGHHVSDEIVRLVWATAAGRLALVTDAIAGAGVGDGSYKLGEFAIDVDGGVSTRKDGGLAGTVLTMIDAVRNLHALGVSFEDAVGAATSVPARIAGRPDLGVLEPGGHADIVVVDDALEIQNVLCAGEMHATA